MLVTEYFYCFPGSYCCSVCLTTCRTFFQVERAQRVQQMFSAFDHNTTEHDWTIFLYICSVLFSKDLCKLHRGLNKFLIDFLIMKVIADFDHKSGSHTEAIVQWIYLNRNQRFRRFDLRTFAWYVCLDFGQWSEPRDQNCIIRSLAAIHYFIVVIKTTKSIMTSEHELTENTYTKYLIFSSWIFSVLPKFQFTTALAQCIP